MALLELDGIEFTWRGETSPVLAVDSLAVDAGERVFLHGPSGSGKSTLLNLVAGFLLPQHGSVSIDGTVVNRLSGRARDRFRGDRLGIVFQQFNLLPFMDVLANVTLPCRFSRKRRRVAEQHSGTVDADATRLLAAMGLDVAALQQHATMQLSVGQQQRVAVARALIGAPALLLADEPTSALDSDTRDAFLQLLFDRLQETPRSALVFVSHDLSLADRFDRTVSLSSISTRAAGQP